MNKKLLLYIILNKNRVHNSINLVKRRGYFVLPNNYRLYFYKENKEDIKNLFAFGLFNGVEFSDMEGYWQFKDNIITTQNNIKFYVKNFNPLIFSETFLSDIHFSDFDLSNKVVLQAGGFIGDTALYYAARGAIVYSFEPDFISYNLALKNIQLNSELTKNIIMKNYAIGTDGEIDFPIDPKGSGSSSAYYSGNKKTIKVKSLSLNSILKEFSIENPFLLDLDVKGKEFEVINDKSLSMFKMIRIEYSTHIGNKVIGRRDDLIEKLIGLGFNKIRIFKHHEGVYDLTTHGTIEAVR